MFYALVDDRGLFVSQNTTLGGRFKYGKTIHYTSNIYNARLFTKLTTITRACTIVNKVSKLAETELLESGKNVRYGGYNQSNNQSCDIIPVKIVQLKLSFAGGEV